MTITNDLSSVANATAGTSMSAADGRNVAGGTLDKDDFLQLLITELQYQDPLDPMDNKDFISQMAQFTSLEQMNNVSTSMDALGVAIETGTQRNLAVDYLGKEVWGFTEEGMEVAGLAHGIGIDEEQTPYLLVGDYALPVDNIIGVTNPLPEDTFAQNQEVPGDAPVENEEAGSDE